MTLPDDAAMLRLKTSPMNDEWEKAGDSRVSRGEGKGLCVRISRSKC